VRNTNQESWNRQIAECSLGGAAAPYLAAYEYPTRVAAERGFERLRSIGLPVMTWPDLPPEVRAEPVLHHASIRLRETRVFLPVHRSIDPASIERAFAATRAAQ
jgi:hypothetical protein